MAYELSSSVANGNVSAEFVAARASTLTRGGAISPDGTTIAVTSYRHGGATTTDYGIDIWKSGSSGWSEVDSIDTLSRIHHQIMWLNNDEFVSLSSNAFYSFKSGSSGWAEDYDVAVGGYGYVAMWPSADKSKIAISQTPKDPYADSTHANNSLGAKIQFLISGSGGYAVEQANYAIDASYGPLQALTWVDNDNIVVGYSGYQSGNGLIFHYRSDGDTTWSSVSYLIGSNTQGRRNLGNFLYYHTGSETLMVGAAGSTSESYNAYRAYINLFPSASSGLFPSNWTAAASWTGWEKLDLDSYGLYTANSNTSNNPYWLDGITLNVDANNGDRFVVASGIDSATNMTNRAFITAESGSSGWLFNQLNAEGNGRGKAWATEYGWGPSQLSDDATRYVTWLTGTSATTTYGFTVYDTGLSSAGGGGGGDVTAPTISSVVLSSDNSTATVTFSEDVYPNSGGSGDLDRYDFSMSLSGGNSSVMTLNSTPSAISKTSQSVWVLTLDGTDLDFAADGTETLVVDAVNDTSIYDGSGNALTEAHSGSNLIDQNPEDYIKIRILNQEDHTLYFYTDVGYYASTLGTNGSKFRLLGSASSGEWMTSSAFPIDKWDVQAFTAGGQILSSRTELTLDQYDTSYIHINSQAETWSDSSFLLTSADIKRADSSSDIRIVSASDGSRVASYLNITRPSGSALREDGDDWGEWTQYDISNTLLDTSKPSVVSSTFNSTNNELSIQFDEKIFDSNGDAYTTSSFSYGSSNQFYFSSLTSASAKNFSIEDLSYSTTTVTDDTLTITISYDGEIVDGEEANWSFSYNTLYDQYGNKNTNSVTGSTLFGATGSTRSTHNKTINIINTSDNTGYFYMKVDGNEGDWVGSSGNPPNDWIYLGTASSGETGSFTISNWAVNDRAYASSGVLTSYLVYGYTSQQLTSSFTSTAPNASSTPNFTIYNVSSSTEPYFADNRRRYDVTYRGSSFGTVIPYSGSTALDIGLNAAIITSSNSSNTLYITVDFGERVRVAGWEATEYGINFSSSINSTSDLSNQLTGSFFRVARDYYYTGSIGSTITVTDVNFITSPSTSVVSGAWAITASYTGIADGTERVEFGKSYSYYPNIYDDSLNSTSLESALASSTYSAIATWPTTDQYGNSYRVGPMTQDSLATEVSEAITAADGGSINAGGTNDAPAATISIPANALSSDTTIGVDVSETPDPGGVGLGFGAQDSVSPLISLTPHGTTFSSPVTVTFKLTGIGDGVCPANLQIWKRDTPTSSWILQDADNWTCTDGEISLTISSFSQILAKGGSLMARTKLNNVQLARIEDQNKVLPEAINLTGSSLAKLSSIADGDLFVVSDASDSGATRIVSASAMTAYFASNVVPTNVPITEQSDSTSYNLLFASGSDSGATLSRDADGELAYNPSTNTLILSTGSFASASFSTGLFAAAAQITSVDINGGTIDGATIAGSDIDMSSQTLTLDDDAISGDKVEGGTIAGITITALSASSADIDGGTIDGAVIGGTTPAAGTFTTLTAEGNVVLGDADSDTLTVNADLASDLIPSTDNVLDLGNGSFRYAEAHIVAAHIDQLGQALDANSQAITNINVDSGAIDGTTIGANNAVAGTFGALTATGSFSAVTGSFSGDLTVAGNLTVQGNTTTVDTANLQVEDAVILLGSGSTGEGTASDRGLLMAMASEENLAMFWDEDADHFAFVRTTASATDNAITPSSYSDLKIKNLTGSAATFTGTVTANAFSGDGSGLSGVGASIDASSNANLDLQLIFTSGTTGVGEVAGLFIDSGSIQYNPSTDTLKVPNVSASTDLYAAVDLAVGSDATIGGTLDVTGITTLSGDVTASSGLHIDGGAVANSMIVEDLTNNRVVFAGTGGELEDSAGLTFDGTSLAVSSSGGIDLNQGDLEVAAGNISGSGNLQAGGTLDVAGVATFSADVTASAGLHVDGGAVANSMIVEDLTDNRVVFAGTGGELEDSAGLTFDGTSLAVSASGGIDVNQGDLEVTAGAISGSGNLQAGGSATIATGLTVTAGGATITDGDVLVQGGDLSASTDVYAGNDLAVAANATVGGTLGVTGIATFSNHVSASQNISIAAGQAIAGAGALDLTAAGLMSITASAGKIALSGSGGIELGVATETIAESADNLLFVDADDGLVKKGSLSTLMDTVGGNGIQVTNGVMSVVTVVDYFSSGSSAGGTLSTDLATASLSQIALSSSIQVFLNGMLQVVSGAVNVATESGGAANIGAFDYKYSGSSGITGYGTSEDGVTAIIFEDGLDFDDVVQIRYIKK